MPSPWPPGKLAGSDRSFSVWTRLASGIRVSWILNTSDVCVAGDGGTAEFHAHAVPHSIIAIQSEPGSVLGDDGASRSRGEVRAWCSPSFGQCLSCGFRGQFANSAVK